VSAEATQNNALDNYEGITLPEGDQPTESRNKRLDDIAAESEPAQSDTTPEKLVPSDRDDRDVEAVPVDEGGDGE